jgi:hypothetical protein
MNTSNRTDCGQAKPTGSERRYRKPVIFKVSEPYVVAVMYGAHASGSIRIVVYDQLSIVAL